MVVPIVLFAEPIMTFIFTHVEDSRYGSLLASTALFFIPTTILGMISPYSVRLLVTDHEKSGQVAGGLYFVSTLGSALGTIITSFYMVLAFDVNDIIKTFAAVLGALGLLAIAVSQIKTKERTVCLESNDLFAHSAALAGLAEVIHKERSLYRNILVEKSGDLLCLKFNEKTRKSTQSCMYESKPKKLVFNYTKMTFASLLIY